MWKTVLASAPTFPHSRTTDRCYVAPVSSSHFMDAVRQASRPSLWTLGVKLAREGAVVIERASETEVSARVRSPGHAVAPTVVLYLADGEWTCDCGGPVDPCAHVAAAAIAHQQGSQQPTPVSRPAAEKARLAYRLHRPMPSTLGLDQLLVAADGSERALGRTLASAIATSTLPVALTPTHADLAIDRFLSAQTRRTLPLARIGTLLTALAQVEDVRFDAQRVRVVAEPLPPRVLVFDDDNAGVTEVVLRVERDPTVSEVVAPGVVLCGDVLRPLGETQLTGMKLENLPLERRFPMAQLGELVADVLPELEKRLEVSITSRHLPGRGGAENPRILFEMTSRGHALSVLPLLVYGDPPRARIDAGKLVHLSGTIPRRNEARERELLEQLRQELDLVPGRRIDADGAEAAKLAGRLMTWQSKHEEAFDGDVVRRVALRPQLRFDGSAFDIAFLGSDGERRACSASGSAVLAAYRGGLELVPLEGGGWAKIPTEWLAQYGGLCGELFEASREGGRLPKAALPGLAELCRVLEEPPPAELEKLKPLLTDFAEIPPAELPSGLAAELRPYQRRGVDWLAFLREAGLGGVLADDMGLGKTLQSLCAARGRTLVVAPRSVVYNWLDEIRRFLPGKRAHLYHGPDRKLDPQADFEITTYAVLRLDIDELEKQRFDTVFLDEAQNIKNPESQTARAAFRLEADFRVALSGTPIENRLDELWSQLHFTNRGLLGGRSDFDARYGSPIAAGDGAALERLRRRIRPVLLRRLKRDVAPDLPARTESVLYVELDEHERALYDTIHAATKEKVLELFTRGGGGMIGALEALLRLRQAACHPALLGLPSGPSSSKLERLSLALVDAVADGHKVLVFSQWTSLLDLVEPLLSEARVAFERLDGSTRDRAGVVERFQASDGPPVLLASLKAGGTGLNLTAADHVFLIDPWWNPAAEDQAADRAHRIGQTRPVFVNRLVAKDTVEERILALQERKRALMLAALEGTGDAVGLTRDDLLSLFD